jgi:hypothetical protein
MSYAHVSSADTQRTAVGMLERITANGSETPGWAINLEKPLVLGDVEYDTIEVYAKDVDLFMYADKRVAATGTFVQWRTKERGKYIVLEICDIVPLD